MASIDIYVNGTLTKTVNLETDVPSDDTPFGYLYNRVTKDQYNALAVTNRHVLLSDVLAQAGVTTPYNKLGFWVDEGSGAVPYTAYDPNVFTYAKLVTDVRGYFDAAQSGTEPTELYEGTFTLVPTVIALNQASATIPTGEVSGAIGDGGFIDDLLAQTSTDQTPRLFWGLSETSADQEWSGSRFPSVIVRIYVTT